MIGGGAQRSDDAHEPALHESLMSAARAGDLESFVALVHPHRARLRSVARLVLGSSSAGDAALDQSLLRAWRGLRGYRGQTSFEMWLTRSLTTTCLRAQPDRRQVTGPVTLQSLPVRQRVVLVLSDALGWQEGEVASALGVTEETVRIALLRGRAALAVGGSGPTPGR